MKMEHNSGSISTEAVQENIDVIDLDSSSEEESETLDQTEGNFIPAAVRRFQRKIDSRFPIRHLADFYDEEKIKEVAKEEEHKIIKKLVDLRKPYTYFSELAAEFQKVTTAKLDENEPHMKKFAPLLETLTDYFCEEHKYEVDKKLKLNPNMDMASLEDWMAAEKTRILQSFLEHKKWLPGDFRVHNGKFYTKITHLQNQYLKKRSPESLIMAGTNGGLVSQPTNSTALLVHPIAGPSRSFLSESKSRIKPPTTDAVDLIEVQNRFGFLTPKCLPRYSIKFESGFRNIMDSYGVKLFGHKSVSVSSTIHNEDPTIWRVKRPHPEYTPEQEAYVKDIEKLLLLRGKRETNVYVKTEERKGKSPLSHVHANCDFPPKTFVSFIGGVLKANMDIEELKLKCQDPDQDLLFYMPPFQDIVHFYNINENKADFGFQGFVGNNNHQADESQPMIRTMFPTCFTKVAKSLEEANVELRMVMRRPNNSQVDARNRNRLHFFLSTLNKPVAKHEELLLLPFWLLPREGQADPEKITYITPLKRDRSKSRRSRRATSCRNPDCSSSCSGAAKKLRLQTHQNTTIPCGSENLTNSVCVIGIDYSNPEAENAFTINNLLRESTETVGYLQPNDIDIETFSDEGDLTIQIDSVVHNLEKESLS